MPVVSPRSRVRSNSKSATVTRRPVCFFSWRWCAFRKKTYCICWDYERLNEDKIWSKLIDKISFRILRENSRNIFPRWISSIMPLIFLPIFLLCIFCPFSVLLRIFAIFSQKTRNLPFDWRLFSKVECYNFQTPKRCGRTSGLVQIFKVMVSHERIKAGIWMFSPPAFWVFYHVSCWQHGLFWNPSSRSGTLNGTFFSLSN